MKKFSLFLGLLLASKICACPITITNDMKQQVIVVDPRGSEAIFLDQNKTEVIDPTITHPMMKYFQNEKLDFYFPNKSQSNSFYKKYRLTEKYCVDDPKKSMLTLSQIINFVEIPTDRFKVEEFHPIEKIHDHSHR